MLVLTRKVGQGIVINGNITVTVTKLAGNRVSLGVEAPDDVVVLRDELEESDSEPANGGPVRA